VVKFTTSKPPAFTVTGAIFSSPSIVYHLHFHYSDYSYLQLHLDLNDAIFSMMKKLSDKDDENEKNEFKENETQKNNLK